MFIPRPRKRHLEKRWKNAIYHSRYVIVIGPMLLFVIMFIFLLISIIKQHTLKEFAFVNEPINPEDDLDGQDNIVDTTATTTTSIVNEPIMVNPEDELSEFMKNLEVGWSQPPPKWLTELCPNVVDHFERFPSFKKETVVSDVVMPFFTSGNASIAVCTLQVTKALAASMDAHLYLHAGSHLGAILHGQPIPWDDDVDAIMIYDKRDDFLAKCENGMQVLEEPKVDLFCRYRSNVSMKVWLQAPGMINYTQEMWFSPFVDLFLFNITKDGLVQEVDPDGRRRSVNYAISDYFPAQPYYFGGIYVLGPQYGIAEGRYNLNACVIGCFNHMLEMIVESSFGTHTFNCSVMSKFPFRNEDLFQMVSMSEH